MFLRRGASRIELDSVFLAGDEVSIQSAKMQMSFTGKLVKDSIVGTYEQMG